MSIDVMAVGAHPDDVDMTLGGTIAKLCDIGREVIILDLTRGEMGSRGSADLRAEEANDSAGVLGVKKRIMLDLGDGILENSVESRRQVIEVIRDLRPKLIFGPYWEDLHPDHAAAGQILRSAMYPSGFARYPAGGNPYRPNEYLFYMAHTPFEPKLVVDITDYHDTKMKAVKCFGSQFDADPGGTPDTVISQPDFLKMLEGRARHFGRLIGRPLGEPLLTASPVPVNDPVAHYEPFEKIYSAKRKEE